MISSCGLAGLLLKSKTGASARPVICMVAVVSPIVVCAVKSSVGSILFCSPAPLKLTRPSVKFNLPVASEKVPRSRSKPPFTKRRSGRAADLQIAAHSRVQPASLHENILGRVDGHIEADDQRFLRGRRLLGAPPPHIEHGDIQRQTVGDADQGAVEVHGSGNVKPFARRPLDGEVRVQIRGDELADQRLSVAGRNRKVNRNPFLQNSHAAAHRHGARRRRCRKAS